MNNPLKIVILLAVAAAAAGVIAMKQNNASSSAQTISESSDSIPSTPLPRLVDLGSVKCIPCQAMAPILEALRRDFDGKLQVTFIDVWKDRAAGEAYDIRIIPTQIFFDAAGKELFRHEGFYSREEILGKWRDLGYEFGAAAGTEARS